MTSLTIQLDDDVLADVQRRAREQGTAVEQVAADAVRDGLARELGEADLTPPPEVMRRIRQRQDDPLENSIPAEEVFAEVRRRLAE